MFLSGYLQNYIKWIMVKLNEMVKLIGILLILSSLLAILMGAFLDAKHVSGAQVTGNLISNIVAQPAVNTGPAYYLEALAFSYSIISLIIGLVFVLSF